MGCHNSKPLVEHERAGMVVPERWGDVVAVSPPVACPTEAVSASPSPAASCDLCGERRATLEMLQELEGEYRTVEAGRRAAGEEAAALRVALAALETQHHDPISADERTAQDLEIRRLRDELEEARHLRREAELEAAALRTGGEDRRDTLDLSCKSIKSASSSKSARVALVAQYESHLKEKDERCVLLEMKLTAMRQTCEQLEAEAEELATQRDALKTCVDEIDRMFVQQGAVTVAPSLQRVASFATSTGVDEDDATQLADTIMSAASFACKGSQRNLAGLRQASTQPSSSPVLTRGQSILENAVDVLKRRLAHLQDEYEALQKRCDRAVAGHDRVERVNWDLAARLEEAEEEGAAAHRDLDAATAEVAALATQLDATKVLYASFDTAHKSEVAALEARCAEVEEGRALALRHADVLTSELAALTEQLDAAKVLQASSNAAVAALEERCVAAEEEGRRLIEEKALLMKKEEEEEAALRVALKTKDTLEAECTGLKHTVMLTGEKLQDMQDRQKKVEHRCGSLERECEALRSDKEELIESNISLAGDLETLRSGVQLLLTPRGPQTPPRPPNGDRTRRLSSASVSNLSLSSAAPFSPNKRSSFGGIGAETPIGISIF
eukprot:TRINITY_DN16879_c0_g1_i1.p1 TRINITY_DN16879_c0_g1~~TRINITY_DN16879_c0_g1_i1.p1  ORF type:complete len:616 (+),score=179.46 TRINITY_DN16879_c0_g1_i1:87-1934(+)